MKKLLFFYLFLALFSSGLNAQSNLRVMFYNVENLFDTKNDPQKNDEDFLPEGSMKWMSWKYWEKLKNISRVITAVGEMQSPGLVGLCEIENDSVIFDLTKRSPLRNQQYEYIVTNSPDERGIDVALLYQRHQFKPVERREYKIAFRNKSTRPTRNILHVTGKLVNGENLDVFVCHFPSRSGGQKESEPARIAAATLLRSKTDSLFKLRKNANIIIMGDFNDHPDDVSIFKTLKARSLNDHRANDELYNLFFHRMKERDFGSYKYRGNWEVLDQFIVSGHLVSGESRVKIKDEKGNVFKAKFLLQDDEKNGGEQPYRTNLGPRYIGGFSDHLPIYLDLDVK
ncbi:MAG: hypothetical protein LBS52_04710 [Dysgonamonadaceae bacterium]|jgi:predicted extracellular nuclease|nr:hypothetical protein [Dysgonamonadaceae bacterium]